MESNTSHKLTNTDVLSLIDDARNAEKYREIQKLQEILQAIWDDIGNPPDYEKYEPPVKAELYRLSGAFLTLYASSRLLKDVQIRAKNLLTKSGEIFEQLNLREKVAETNLWLGYAYGSCGEFREQEAYYDSIEDEVGPDHPIQTLVMINRLFICIYTDQIKEGEKLLKKHSTKFSECVDLRLRAMLHNNAGIIYRRGKNLDDAADHFNKAVELSRETEILSFEASNLNNLALLYRDCQKFEEAHASAQNALQVFIKAGDRGSIPKILDTEALIFLAEKKYEEALQAAERALEYFLEGEDYNGITDSYWTKTLCLLRLDRHVEACIEFGKLQQIAAEQIGDVAVKKFELLMRDEIYLPPSSLPLEEKIRAFTKHHVKRGLLQNGLKVTRTAKALGFKHHEDLRNILKTFPELYDEIGMPRPKTRVSKKKKAKADGENEVRPPFFDHQFIRNDVDWTKHSPSDPDARTYILRSDQILEEKIYEIQYENVNFSFDFDYDSDLIETYYFDEDWMRKFGIPDDCIVAAAPLTEFKVGEFVLIEFEKRIIAGQLQYSRFEGIYFIEDERHGPIPLTAEDVIGVPVGYCRADDVGDGEIHFSRLQQME